MKKMAKIQTQQQKPDFRFLDLEMEELKIQSLLEKKTRRKRKTTRKRMKKRKKKLKKLRKKEKEE